MSDNGQYDGDDEEQVFTLPSPLPKAELREFIRSFCDGKIWSNLDCAPQDVSMVFMPIALGALEGATKEQCGQIGLVYEYLDAYKAPMGINGNPCFFSCRLLLKSDWVAAQKAIKKELLRRDNGPLWDRIKTVLGIKS